MVLLNFAFGDVFDELLNWLYSQLIGFLSDFFALMGNMGAELFEISWVQSIILFFSYLAWSLYVVGLVVALFETAIEYQSGRGSFKDLSINAIKGFMAVSLFSIVPVRLYELSVSLQGILTKGLSGSDGGISELTSNMMTELQDGGELTDMAEGFIFANMPGVGGVMILFVVFMIGYAIIKVFFASLKRGGILLIQIAVGSLYLFSVPRGYTDGFTQWCKQIVALCLTSFLQVTILTAGLMLLYENALLGLGLMLSAGEVPRIAGVFGLDTSTKPNVSGAMHTTNVAVNSTKSIISAVAK